MEKQRGQTSEIILLNNSILEFQNSIYGGAQRYKL